MNIKTYITKDMPEGNFINIGLLLLRLTFGLSLAVNHGWPTFSGIFKGEFGYPDPLGIGSAASMVMMGFAEFICALLVTIGFATRLTALPVVFGFAVAFFIFHSGDPFGSKELAFMYGSVFLVIAWTGPGKYSADAKIFK